MLARTEALDSRDLCFVPWWIASMVTVRSAYVINVLKDEGPDAVMCCQVPHGATQGRESWTPLLHIKEWQSEENSRGRRKWSFQRYFSTNCRETDLRVREKLPQTWHGRIRHWRLENIQRKSHVGQSKQNSGIHPTRERRDTTFLHLMPWRMSKAVTIRCSLIWTWQGRNSSKKIHFHCGGRVRSILGNNGKINYFSIRWSVLINSRQRPSCDVPSWEWRPREKEFRIIIPRLLLGRELFQKQNFVPVSVVLCYKVACPKCTPPCPVYVHKIPSCPTSHLAMIS